MKLMIDIPNEWFNQMVREEFTKVDELCAIIQHSVAIKTFKCPHCEYEINNGIFDYCPLCGAVLEEV